MEKLTAGTIAGNGTFRCDECGAVGPLARTADVPACPQCGSTRVTRASLFASASRFSRVPDATIHGTLSLPGSDEVVAAARDMAPEAGRYLAYLDGAELRLVGLDAGQVRIGRSLTADLRFDDQTVSRRHALVVMQADGSVKVLDDRSLNGVFVNGERIEWRVLRDGDEVVIGRHTLHFVDTATSGSGTASKPAAGTA